MEGKVVLASCTFREVARTGKGADGMAVIGAKLDTKETMLARSWICIRMLCILIRYSA